MLRHLTVWSTSCQAYRVSMLLIVAIARDLRRRHKKSLLVVNKVDKPGDSVVHDFHRLGLGEPHPVEPRRRLGARDLA